MKRSYAVHLVAALLTLVATFWAAGAAAEIKLGWVGPLSGPVAVAGLPNKAATELAVKEVNDAGGINGEQVKVIYADDKFRPAESRIIVQRFILSDKVTAILGPLSSTSTLAVMDLTKRYRVPHISARAGATEIGRQGHPFVFRTIPHVGEYMGPLTELAIKEWGYKRFGVMLWEDEAGRSTYDGFKKALKIIGGAEIVSVESHGNDVKDYRSLLSKMRRKNPDAVLITGLFQQGGLMVKQAREMGWKVPFLGCT